MVIDNITYNGSLVDFLYVSSISYNGVYIEYVIYGSAYPLLEHDCIEINGKTLSDRGKFVSYLIENKDKIDNMMWYYDNMQVCGQPYIFIIIKPRRIDLEFRKLIKIEPVSAFDFGSNASCCNNICSIAVYFGNMHSFMQNQFCMLSDYMMYSEIESGVLLIRLSKYSGFGSFVRVRINDINKFRIFMAKYRFMEF